ncbi:MAG: acetate--CoA ligase family protein [Anaerolineaceae bacterium]|jgi:acetyl coenzyme A synthetase (ADP forming)-like protein
MPSSITPFFKAKGVAILGASAHPNKLSYGILDNLLTNGFEGEVFPVNPTADQILGKKVYANVLDVPDPVELAVVALPSGLIPQTLEECGKRGIKAVVIISSGFKEIGQSGAELEKKCLDIARRYCMRIIGPNCVGTLDTFSRLDATFFKGMPEKGHIGFISQSGAILGGVVDLTIESKLGFSIFASLGNEMDVNETDMLEYLEADENTKVIAMYIEGIQNGPRFMKVATRVARKKPILFLKAGRNEAGAKAVSSHTGSMAGSYTAYQTALKQAGVLEVDTIAQLFASAWALATQPLPAGNRVALATNAGGAAALAADSLYANEFTLASISDEGQEMLRTKLNQSAQVSNPVDMLGSVSPEDYLWSLENLRNEEGVDVMVPILVPQALVDTMGVAQAWIEVNKKTSKTLLACLMGQRSTSEATALLNQNSLPVYTYPDQIGFVLKVMKEYKEILKRPAEDLPERIADPELPLYEAFPTILDKREVGEYETRQFLEHFGIRNVPGSLAFSEQNAVEAAHELGYPVVLKIVADSILHKSEAGGIAINIINEDKLRVAYKEMMSQIKNNYPDAGLRGVLVEKMAVKGQEVIVGMRRDATFGPMLMFGMGGTWVELLKDISFRIAPLSRHEARGMISETIAGRLLAGYRGSTRADIDTVVEVILKLSEISSIYPEISELEINPLIVYPEGKGALALDSRMILN